MSCYLFFWVKIFFFSKEALSKAWENLHFEVLNQKICRLLTSVHKRCSRLAALGELGRYPSIIPALKNCLKYEWLQRNDNGSIICNAVKEMAMASNPWHNKHQQGQDQQLTITTALIQKQQIRFDPSTKNFVYFNHHDCIKFAVSLTGDIQSPTFREQSTLKFYWLRGVVKIIIYHIMIKQYGGREGFKTK